MKRVDKLKVQNFDRTLDRDMCKTKLVSDDREKLCLEGLKDLSTDDFFATLESSSVEDLEDLLHTFEPSTLISPSAITSSGGRWSLSNFIAIVGFWELRRPAYNLLVGLSGLLAVIALTVINHVPASFLLLGAFGYFVGANLFFTLSCCLHIVVRMILGENTGPFGERLFLVGTSLSVMTTLAIAVILPFTFMLVGVWL